MLFLNKIKKIKQIINKQQKNQTKQVKVEPLSSDFYQQAEDWFYDIYQSQTVWLKRAFVGLGISSLLLLLSLISNLLLLPLKEKVPYLYSFDKATGEVTKLGALEPATLPADWTMSRYFLTLYVINREGYDFNNIDYPYQVAWAMSDDSIRKQYDAEVGSTEKTSPYQMYGKNKSVIVNVLSVSRLNENTAQVRFDKVLHDHESGQQQVSHKVAIIKWQYIKEPVTQKVLDRNPLGFKVTYYQITQVAAD